MVYHLAILLVFTTCEGFLLGALSANANTLNRWASLTNIVGQLPLRPIDNVLIRGQYRGKYSLKKIDHIGENMPPGNSRYRVES